MITSFTFPELNFHRQTPRGSKPDLECSPQAKTLVAEAELMGVSWAVVPFSTVIAFTYKGHTEYARNGGSPNNKIIGYHVCVDKYLTRVMLAKESLPIAKGFAIVALDTAEDRESVFNALTKPLVIKPAFGAHGTGVKLGVSTLDEMNSWLDFLFSSEEKDTDGHVGMVMVEETIVGNEYRILATRERVLAVMNRQPASVTGDGSQTIEELIAEKNKDPMRNIDEGLYPKIKIDADMREVLTSQQLDEKSVPAVGQKVQLRRISNIMAGGDAVDMTDAIHPSVADIAVRVCRAIPGMALVGIDYMTTDITKDQQFEQHAVIEVNSAPEYTMHDFPMIGKKRGVAREILKMMFPEWVAENPGL